MNSPSQIEIHIGYYDVGSSTLSTPLTKWNLRPLSYVYMCLSSCVYVFVMKLEIIMNTAQTVNWQADVETNIGYYDISSQKKYLFHQPMEFSTSELCVHMFVIMCGCVCQ